MRRGEKGVCPGTGKLAGADPTLNRWGSERFSHLPGSHTARQDGGSGLVILEDPQGDDYAQLCC